MFRLAFLKGLHFRRLCFAHTTISVILEPTHVHKYSSVCSQQLYLRWKKYTETEIDRTILNVALYKIKDASCLRNVPGLSFATLSISWQWALAKAFLNEIFNKTFFYPHTKRSQSLSKTIWKMLLYRKITICPSGITYFHLFAKEKWIESLL